MSVPRFLLINKHLLKNNKRFKVNNFNIYKSLKLNNDIIYAHNDKDKVADFVQNYLVRGECMINPYRRWNFKDNDLEDNLRIFGIHIHDNKS